MISDLRFRDLPLHDKTFQQGDDEEEDHAGERSKENRGPQLFRPGGVILVEVEDYPAQAVGDAAGQFTDDGADYAGRGRDFEAVKM